MNKVTCIGCGQCCQKHWKVKLSRKHELELFKNHVIDGGYVFTDECPYLDGKKCIIQEEKPYKCKEYYCEKYYEE